MRQTLSVLLFLLVLAVSLSAEDTQPSSPATAIAAPPATVTIPLITRNENTGQPIGGLKLADLRVLDKGQPVPIRAFRSGFMRGETRPALFWLVVQCNLKQPSNRGSAFLQGKTAALIPALQQLDRNDQIGVAYWCDNGEAALDVWAASEYKAALQKLEAIVSAPPRLTDLGTSMAKFKEMLLRIVQRSQGPDSGLLPVIVFLYGDGGMPFDEPLANFEFADTLVGTPIMVYGIKQEEHDPDQVAFRMKVARYLVDQSGGQYFHVPLELVGPALGEVITQIHFRYELDIAPQKPERKRRELKIEMTDESRRKAAMLRARPQFTPLPIIHKNR